MATTFVEFLRNKLESRVRERNLLVFYDATRGRIFREVIQGLGDLVTPTLDAETDPIGARRGMAKAVRDGAVGVFLYVPQAVPQTDEARKEDPWSVYAVIGTPFPRCPADEYEALACECYLEKKDEIHQLFAENDGEPSFSAVDKVGHTSGKWPILQAESGKETPGDLLKWLLTTREHENIFRAKRDVMAFLEAVLGICEVQENVEPGEIQRLCWDRALLTDYLAGFGESLPVQFRDVPRAPQQRQLLVVETIASIRRDTGYESLYCDRADDTENRLKLDPLSKDLPVEVERETFRFVERRELKQALEALACRDIDAVKGLLPAAKSVWAGSDNATLQWAVVRSGFDYLANAEKFRAVRLSPNCSVKELVAGYVHGGGSLDAAVRLLEKSYEEYEASPESVDVNEELTEAFARMRKSLLADYRLISGIRQKTFMARLKTESWPVVGLQDNARVFDDFVAPKLQDATRAVVFIIVDGLRYELGELLAQQLQSLRPQLQPACARMPSITSVGKATLLPSGMDVVLEKGEDGRPVPMLKGQKLAQLSNRMQYLKSVYGERFQEMSTRDFLSGNKRLSERTALLVLRNDDIDKYLEGNESGLLNKVQSTINELRRTVDRVRQATKVHFTDIVIATDHGFVLNYVPEESDVCPKPEGNWTDEHDRMLLGRSAGTHSSNEIFPAAQLGISGVFAEVAVPIGLCAYAANRYYFHGGISLEEAVVPVILLQLEAPKEKESLSQVGGKVNMRAKKDRFTSVIARVYVADPNGKNEGSHPTTRQVEICISRAGDRLYKSVGCVNDNEANLVTLDGSEETEVKIRLDDAALYEGNSSESVRKVLVRALDPTSRVLVGEVRFEVELTQ